MITIPCVVFRLLQSHPTDVRLFLWPPIFSGCWGHHPYGSPVEVLTEVLLLTSAWRSTTVPDPQEVAPVVIPSAEAEMRAPARPGPMSLLER
jgi:hypothetical protein